MDNVDLSVLNTLQIQPDLMDDINTLSSIIGVDVDTLFCDAIKMYLSAFRICSHRILDGADSVTLVKVDNYGDQDLS